MKKKYLIAYYSNTFQSLNSGGTTFTLWIKITWLWGLFETKEKISYCVPAHHHLYSYIENWDNIIKNNFKRDISDCAIPKWAHL